jgi:hypothetical protein
MFHSHRCVRVVCLLLFVGLVFVALSVHSATASTIETAGFKLSVSEDLSVLKNDTAKNRMMAAWTTPTQLAMERNTPYLMLQNTSDMEMSSFSMTIGRETANFDWAKVISKSAGVTASLVTPDKKEGGLRSDVITFNLDGFTPGKSLIFRVDIDADSKKANPFGEFSDYRRVFFNLNTDLSLSKNSQLTATFVDPSDSSSIVVGPAPWRDPTGIPGLYTQPQDGQRTVFGLAFQGHYMNDFVRSYQTGNLTPVPEPGTLVLAGLGAAGLFVFGRRFRAKKVAAYVPNGAVAD